MKKLFYILLATFALSFIAVSCEDGEGSEVSIVQNVTIVDSDLVFTPAGGNEGYITFEANGVVSVTCNKTWCTAVVTGNTVTVSCEPNYSNETRYARISLTCNGTTTEITVQQYGEVIDGLEISDITANVEGTVVQIEVKTNLNILLESEYEWIHPVYEKPNIIITVDENTEHGTRLGTFSYSAGSVSGTVNVTQYPPLIKATDITLAAGATTFNYPEFKQAASVEFTGEDGYVYTLVPAVKLGETSIVDYIFNTFAVETRNTILADMETSEKTFSEYLTYGNQDLEFGSINVGKNYLILVAFGDNTFVTGMYQYLEINIEDVRPSYYKWAGKWTMTGTNYQNNPATPEEWTISIDEDHLEESLLIDGMFAVGTTSVRTYNADQFVLDYDSETGDIFIKHQMGIDFPYSSSYGTCNMELRGYYTKNGGSSYSWVKNSQYVRISIDADSQTASGTPMMRTSDNVDYPYAYLRVLLVRQDTGGAYSLTASNNYLPTTFTLTRVIE